MPFWIHDRVYRSMIEHALLEDPHECCGFLSGKDGVIVDSLPASNALASPSAFQIPPEEITTFFRELRGGDRSFAGLYHSHPHSEPVPSDRDVREFHYPEGSYWIISLQSQEPEIRVFAWDRIGFREESFRVVTRLDNVLNGRFT